MTIVKKNGDVVIFDNQEIVDDILSVYDTTIYGEEKNAIIEDANSIASFIQEHGEDGMTTMEIRDSVEIALMGYGWYFLARDYIKKPFIKEEIE